MKMLSIVCMAVLLFAGCTKTEIKPETGFASASTENNSIVNKRSDFLVSHPWMYEELYFHYVNKHQKGDPQYVRGASGNVINLDDTRYVFKKNGTFVEHDGGYTYPGTWKFTDNTASLLILDYTYWTDNDSILLLKNDECNYTAPMGYRSKSYTELIPAL